MKILLVGVGACVVASILVLVLGLNPRLQQNFSACITGLLAILVLLYRHKSNKVYGNYILGAFLLYVISDILMILYNLVPYPIIFFSLANLVVLRSILLFHGYTFNTFHLILVSLVLACFYFAAKESLGNDHSLIVVYILILLILCWQGLNLFFIQRSNGARAISLFSSFFLINNVVQGTYQYIIPSKYIEFTSHMCYTIALLFLALSTTYSHKDFRTQRTLKISK